MAAGFKRASIRCLVPGRYSQWHSLFSSYLDIKSNGEISETEDTTPRYNNDNQSGQFGNQRTDAQLLGLGKQKPKRVKDYAYHKEKMMMCKQAEQGVPLQAEQADWLEDTDEEIDEQELEAHYSYMAKIQEVSPAESSSTDTPLEQVQNHDENDVFANVRRHSEQPESINDTYVLEKDDSNVIPDSSNICTNDNQVDQNAAECVDERAALANLIANLTLDMEENKTVQKQLKKANASLTQELKECKTNLDESSRALGEATSSRDSSLIALQTKQTELEKYTALNDLTSDYKILQTKLNDTLGLLAIKNIDISVVNQKHDELVKKSLLNRSQFEGQLKEKTKVISDLKVKEGKDIDTMIEMEKQIKFLNEILYKRNQSIQTIHMLAPKCATYHGRSTFANPKYCKQAQSNKPCLYQIPYDTSDPANRFAPDGEEIVTLTEESRSKLDKDTVKPYNYTYQNSLYENFKPPSKAYLDQLERAKEVRKTMWRKTFEMNDDLEYVNSLEKELDELESEKADFSNIYDLLLEECVSKDVTCSYLHSMSDLNANTELQCLYLHKVKECECLAQKLSKQTESVKQRKKQMKNNPVCKENASNVFRKEREQYHEIQDLKAQMPERTLYMDTKALRTKKIWIARLGLNHNLFSFVNSVKLDLEVAFQEIYMFCEDLQGNDYGLMVVVDLISTQYLLRKTTSSIQSVSWQSSPLKLCYGHRKAFSSNFNDVVKRRNRTLVEAARTMLSASKLPLSFWAKAVATACYTQNRSIIISTHGKTAYHIINDRKPSIKHLHIFGCICYITRDGENLDKMKEKGDPCVMVGYSTRLIVESIHIKFDEIKEMMSDHNSSDLAPQRQEMSVENVSLGLVPQGQKASDYDKSGPVPPRQNVIPIAEKIDSSQQGLEFLFSPLLEEYYYPAHGHAEDNNNDQAPNASFQEVKFINPFCTWVQEIGEPSSRNIDNTDVHSFQPQSHDYRWTRDQSIRNYIVEPKKTLRESGTAVLHGIEAMQDDFISSSD
ncbi:retrovirus-related pol polyprotein from transposon TNT 1-94 [Tanacetum coccineum]